MSFLALNNFQTVSCNNLQNAVNIGYFTLKNTIPASAKQITKDEANTYVYLDTSITSYANKASNQLVVKSDLVASFSYSGNFYIRDIINSVTEGFSSSGVACNDYLGTGLTPGKDAYSLFVQNGYNKSIEDFKQLISTNSEVLQDAHNLFVQTGYTAYWNGSLVAGTLVFLTIPSFAPLDINDYFIIVYGGTPYWVKFNTLSFNIDYGFKGIFYAAHTIESIGTCIACKEYFNNSGSTYFNISGNDCNGNAFTNISVDPNQSICAQEGSLYGGDSGFLIDIGNC